ILGAENEAGAGTGQPFLFSSVMPAASLPALVVTFATSWSATTPRSTWETGTASPTLNARAPLMSIGTTATKVPYSARWASRYSAAVTGLGAVMAVLSRGVRYGADPESGSEGWQMETQQVSYEQHLAERRTKAVEALVRY